MLSPRVAIELVGKGERGWGFLLSGGTFIVPPRVSGSARPLFMRPLGEVEWVELLDDGSDSPGTRSRGLVQLLPFADTGPSDESLNVFILWGQLLVGERTFESAADAAAHLTSQPNTADKILLEAAVAAKELALRGYTEEARYLGGLLVVASATPSVDTSPRVRAEIACEFLEVARLRLIECPDPKLLQQGRTAGEAALAWGREHHDDFLVQAAPFRLGTLHLDPYTSNRDQATYWLQHAAWLRRGMSAVGKPPNDIAEEDLYTFMPLPVAALRTAERYLREAANARIGEGRGLALKALTQALVNLRGLGEAVGPDEISAIAVEALSLLPEEQEDARLFVWQFVSASARSAISAPRVPVGPAAGQSDLSSALVTAAAAAAGHDPATATALVVKRRELLTGVADPDWVVQLLLELSVAIQNTLLPAHRDPEDWPEDVPTQAALRVRLRDGDDPESVRCALLLSLAEFATASGIGSEEALLCVDDALVLDPAHLGAPEDAISYLRARLWFDRAGNIRKAGAANLNAIELVWAYARAANLFHRTGVTAQAIEALESLTGFFPLLARQDYAEIVIFLSGVTMGLGDLADPEADRVVQNYHATTLGHMLSAGINHELLLFTCQTAKGSRLASALSVGRRAGLTLPASLQTDFDRAELDEATLADELVQEEVPEDEDWLLTSFADTIDAGPSDTPLHRLRRRQKQLDREWNRCIPEPGKSLVRSLTGIQELLDERTMLLTMIPAMWRTGTWGACWSLVTKTDAHMQFVDSHVPFGDVRVEVSGRTMSGSPDCALAVALRQDLQEDPGPDVATKDVLRILDGRRRLGDLWLRLDELLRDGHDQLLVSPHGPGHYVPWHLLGEPNEPLAERCAVSVLPSLSMLNPGTFTDLAMSRLHDHPPACFGLSYRKVSSHGRGELPDAEDEATAIAGILGVTAVLEERATADAVIRALQTARFVHIAAHGRHNVDASAFQSIQLAGSPGRLPAHRLSTCDLRGLNLVTLSACETALGRFDRADNLRGIPSALLLAGVGSIVGTLWPVRSSAAKEFFVALYGSIASGASVTSAYRTAQDRTRRVFPAYRDWGAFILMGGLSDRYQSRRQD